MLEPWDRSQTEELAAFLGGSDWPYHVAGTPTRERVLARVADGVYDGPEVRTFWIVAGGERLGLVRLFDLDDDTPDFDLRLVTAARGRGLGTAALRELTDLVFAEHPAVERIESATRSDNVAMRRVFERCGYVREAVYRRAWPDPDGHRYDAHGYATLRPGSGYDVPWLLHVRVNVTDLARSIAWYESVLGVRAGAHWPPEAPAYVHFQLGPTQLGLSVLPPGPAACRLNLTVPDVDAWWARLRHHPVVEPLFDTPYGTRKFTLADPDGNELGFVDS